MPRQGALPLYEQVRRQLLAAIEAGELQSGDFLPPEATLCDRFGVSRITLRRAVGELCKDGRLIRQQGRGTVVAPPRITQDISLAGFAEVIAGLGHRPGHRILRKTEGEGTAGLAAGTPIRFDRILEVDGRPLTFETLFFDAARFPRVVASVEAGQSFYEALETCHGVTPAGALRRILVGHASHDEARAIGITPAEPVYRIEKTVLDRDELPLAVSHLITPCHLVSLSIRS